jgi:hypothetical protein
LPIQVNDSQFKRNFFVSSAHNRQFKRSRQMFVCGIASSNELLPVQVQHGWQAAVAQSDLGMIGL